MRYWLVAFAIALVVVLGYAVGLLGLLIVALVLGAALFLLWVDQLGFGGAWTAFGFDRFDAPVLGPDNWDRFAALIQDREKVARALTIALALTALWLTLPEEVVLLGVIVAVGWYAQRIHARRLSSPGPTAVQRPASARAGSAAPAPAPSPTRPASLGAPIEAVPAPPSPSAILLVPSAPSEPRSTSSTATVSFMIRGTMSSASSLALMARARYRKHRVRRSPKRPKRQSMGRTARKPTRHVPLHLKLPQGRRTIRRPKRPLQSGPKLPSRRASKPSTR
jgi:hypothetical protein